MILVDQMKYMIFHMHHVILVMIQKLVVFTKINVINAVTESFQMDTVCKNKKTFLSPFK